MFALIEIRTYEMGKDKVFLVTGGTAHIGASATAYWAANGEACVEVVSVPGHRERELAVELAIVAASTLRRTVAVLIGIHLDRPTKQEISDVVEEARRKLQELLMRACARPNRRHGEEDGCLMSRPGTWNGQG